MEFERADLSEDNAWFDSHWPRFQEPMSRHALSTFPTFEWKGFRSWLKTSNVGPAQELYRTFEQMASNAAGTT